MKLEDYQFFTNSLIRNLAKDPRVEGVVALGSMASQDIHPDRWSDHDFFVIVGSGHQEWFRNNMDWLPSAAEILFSYRETTHGVKVLYRDGHLVEFAVFDWSELDLAKVNRYRILIDRGGIAARIAVVQEETVHWVSESQEVDETLIGNFLTNLIVGVARYCRGERLSGRQFVHAYALRHLLILLARRTPAPMKASLDDLDPFRRFERVQPEVGRDLNEALTLPVPEAALRMLDIAQESLAELFQNLPAETVTIVRQTISER